MSEMVHIHRFECHGRNKEFVPLDEYRTLRDERDRLALDLKKRIWLLHGARMNHLLYGDDGRMDCNVCFREYAGATLEQCYEWEIADARALIAKAALTPAGQRWTRKRNKQSLLASVAPMVARDLAPLYKHMCSKAKEKPMFSNELTPAENERLALLAEEMGEAIQAIGKILRHGYESTGPKTIVRNRTSLEKELGDVRLAISMMVDSGDLSSVNLKDFEEDKRRRVGQYLHHNTLTPNEATE